MKKLRTTFPVLVMVVMLIGDIAHGAVQTFHKAADVVATESSSTGMVSVNSPTTGFAGNVIGMSFQDIPSLQNATIVRMDIQFTSSIDSVDGEQVKVWVESSNQPLPLVASMFNVSSRLESSQTMLSWTASHWTTGKNILLEDVDLIVYELHRANADWTLVVILSDLEPSSSKEFTGSPVLILEYLDCTGMVCANGGSCRIVNNGTTRYEACNCPEGYLGNLCETDCTSLSNPGCDDVCEIGEWHTLQPCNRACDVGDTVQSRSIISHLPGADCGSSYEISPCVVEQCSQSATSIDKAPLITALEVTDRSIEGYFNGHITVEWGSKTSSHTEKMASLEFFLGTEDTQYSSPILAVSLSRETQTAIIPVADILITNETYIWVFVRKIDGLSPYPSSLALSSATYKTSSESHIPGLWVGTIVGVAALLLLISLFVHYNQDRENRTGKITLENHRPRIKSVQIEEGSVEDILQARRKSTPAVVFSNPMFSLRSSQAGLPVSQLRLPVANRTEQEVNDEWDYSDMQSTATGPSSKGDTTYESLQEVPQKDAAGNIQRAQRKETQNVTLRRPEDIRRPEREGEREMHRDALSVVSDDEPYVGIEHYSRVLDSFKDAEEKEDRGLRRNSTSHLF